MRPAAPSEDAAPPTDEGDREMQQRMQQRAIAVAMSSLLAIAATPAVAADKRAADPAVARGRYLVNIGGCNDCHTPGYAMNGGKADDNARLIGDALGWRGPWARRTR